MNIEFPEPKKCRRCKVDFVEGDKILPIFHQAKGRKQFEYNAQWKSVYNSKRYFLDGDALGSSTWYHQKCIPPNIWHKLDLSGRPGPATPLSAERP